MPRHHLLKMSGQDHKNGGCFQYLMIAESGNSEDSDDYWQRLNGSLN